MKKWLVYGAVAFVSFLLGAGVAISGDDTGEINAEVATLEREKKSLEDELLEAEAAADNARAEIEAEFAERKATLDDREGQLERRARKLRRAERKVQELAELGDGIWETGKDFPGGTYRSNSEDCYWAKLEDLSDRPTIITNSNGPTTVVIDSPWFETTRCGQWEKID